MITITRRSRYTALKSGSFEKPLTIEFESDEDLTGWNAYLQEGKEPLGDGVGILIASGRKTAARETRTIEIDPTVTDEMGIFTVAIYGRQ